MGDGLLRQSTEWGDLPYGGGWEDRLVASCPRFLTCAAFLKRKYNVSEEEIQSIGRTLYSGLSGGFEGPQALGSVFAENPSAKEVPTTLRAVSSTVLASVPLLGWNGNAQCDSDLNLYAQTGAPDSVSLLKLARDGSKYELYSVPADVAGNVAFRSFSVTPSGELRALADTHDHQTYVFEWRSDPSNPDRIKLDVPEHLTTKSIAVFQRGTMLVAGYFSKGADEQEHGNPFIAVFQPSGKLAVRITPRFGGVNLASLRTKLYEGASAVGDDGFIYLLRSDEVVVISESGQVVRRMPFKKPDSSLLATRVDESGGVVLVQLDGENGVGKPFRVEYLALDASTGKRRGLYVPESKLGNNLVCFIRNEGLTFLTVKDDKQVLVTAPLP
jgi:hypothetical protein